MLSALYDRLARQEGGLRALAAARLRRRVLVLFHEALDRSGRTQSDLARGLGIRRSAVNQVFRGDGNVRIDTLAEYLHELGCELNVHLVPAGEPRQARLEEREIRPMDTPLTRSSFTVLSILSQDEPVGLRAAAVVPVRAGVYDKGIPAIVVGPYRGATA